VCVCKAELAEQSTGPAAFGLGREHQLLMLRAVVHVVAVVASNRAPAQSQRQVRPYVRCIHRGQAYLDTRPGLQAESLLELRDAYAVAHLTGWQLLVQDLADLLIIGVEADHGQVL